MRACVHACVCVSARACGQTSTNTATMKSFIAQDLALLFVSKTFTEFSYPPRRVSVARCITSKIIIFVSPSN